MRRLMPGVVSTLMLLWMGCRTDFVVPAEGLAQVQPEVIDFGRVALGTTAVKELRVKNVGRAELVLRDFAVMALGDEVQIANRGKKVLRYGESTVLVVRYAPRDEAILESRVEVNVHNSDPSLFNVPVTGVGVRPRVSVDPLFLDFGRIEIGVPETRTVTLRNEFDTPIEARLGRMGDQQFSFEPNDSIAVEAGGTADVTLTFLPKRSGAVKGELVVLPCETCAEQRVSLVGTGIDRALVVIPEIIDFGYVPSDRQAMREFTVGNVGSHVLEVQAMELLGSSVGAQVFRVDPATATLQEGEQIQVKMYFVSQFMGLATDTLRITSTSRRFPVTDVLVRGIGGGAEIKVTPPSLDFGRVPLGSRPHLFLTISNIGVDAGAPPLEVNVFPAPGSSQAFGTDWVPEDGNLVPAGGEPLQIPIWYEPHSGSLTSRDEGRIVVTSNDGSQPTIEIPVFGQAYDAPPCEGLVITPESLDFGALDENRGAVLSFTIRNTGNEVCIMRDLDITSGSDKVFFTRRVDSFVIRPQGWFGWMVEFNPRRAGAGLGGYVGELELFSVNGGNTRYTVPLRAMSGNGCLEAVPPFVDFGADASGCGSKRESVTYTNVCSAPVDVLGIEIGAQTAPDEFRLSRRPGTPFSLAAGGQFQVEVEWMTEVRGINSAPLYVRESARERPLMVPLLGELTADASITDRFVQHQEGKTDILLVIDNSASMGPVQPTIAASVGALIDRAASSRVDYRIAVTTTGIQTPEDLGLPPCPGGANGAEAGRFFPVDASRPRIITPTTPNGRQILADNTQVGLCAQVEEGMQAMRLALSEPLVGGTNAGFLRKEANLAVLFISDEDDRSGYSVSEYLAFLQRLKGLGGASAHGIVDGDSSCPQTAGVAHRYVSLIRSTGGRIAPVCHGNWTAVFDDIANQAYRPRTSFTLSQTPDANGVQVFVNGSPARAGDWTYDRASNSIRFNAGRSPPAGADITVTYTATCG